VESYNAPCGIANIERRIEQDLAIAFLMQLSSRRVHACKAKTWRAVELQVRQNGPISAASAGPHRQEPDGECANGRNALDD
jgi:hypothetical protein